MNDRRRALSLLAVALLAGVLISLPWLPGIRTTPARYTLEMELRASGPAQSQVYYDVGRSLNEEDASKAMLAGTGQSEILRFDLPPGTYQGIRFDPATHPLQFDLLQSRIVDQWGREKRIMPATAWEAWAEIRSLVPRPDGIQVSTTPDATDPGLWLAFPQPLVLEVTTRSTEASALGHILVVALGVWLILLLLPRSRPLFDALGRFRQRRPRAALVLVALGATLISSYPMVFFGRSWVSPNYGARLLYDALPTLPGHEDDRYEDVAMSDVGAIMWQHIPMSFVQARTLRAGELPLWNRYNSSGTLLLGQGQSMVGDPLQFLVILAGADAWAWDLKFLSAKFVLCLGLSLLAWGVTRAWGPAALIGGSSAFLGFFLYRVNHPAYFSFCYAPWILVAWFSLLKDPQAPPSWKKLLALMAANGWVMTSGTVKEAYMLLISLNGTGVLLVLLSRDVPWRARLRLLGWASGAGALFLLLTAPLWVTLVEALRVAYTGYNQPSAYQIHPSFLIGFFDEVFYRPIQTLERVSNPSANFVYLGGLLYALVTWRRCPPAGPWGSALLIGFVLNLAMAFGVVPPQLIERVPFLGNVAHIDNCFSLVAILLAAPLAAIGWSTAARRLGGPEGRGDLAMVAIGLGALVAFWLATTQTVHKPILGWDQVFSALKWGHRLPVSAFVWGSLAALPLALLLGLGLWRLALRRGGWGPAGGACATLCLGVLLWRHAAHLPSGFDNYVFNPTERTSFFHPSPSVAAVHRDTGGPFRVIGTEGSFVSGWSPAYGLEGISGPDALVNRWYRELTDALGIDRIHDWRLMARSATFPDQRPLFDFLGVKYYFSHPGVPDPWIKGLTPVIQADLDLYRSEHVWPRAFFATHVEPYDQLPTLAARLQSGASRPLAAVEVSEIRPEWITRDEPATVTPARDYRLTPNSTRFSLTTTQPGMAVLQEAWLPHDFRVTLNGTPAEVIRVNHAFKGVWLPAAGEWTVEFTYRPRYFNRALAASGCGAVLLVGLLTYQGRHRRRSAP